MASFNSGNSQAGPGGVGGVNVAANIGGVGSSSPERISSLMTLFFYHFYYYTVVTLDLDLSNVVTYLITYRASFVSYSSSEEFTVAMSTSSALKNYTVWNRRHCQSTLTTTYINYDIAYMPYLCPTLLAQQDTQSLNYVCGSCQDSAAQGLPKGNTSVPVVQTHFITHVSTYIL